MSDDASNHSSSASAHSSGSRATSSRTGSEAAKSAPTWREVWQLPTVVASGGLLLLGLFMLLSTRPPNEFDESFDRIRTLADNGQLVEGMQLINELAVYQGAMSALQRGRYHLLRGDLFYLRQQTEGGIAQSNLRQTIGDYRLADEGGWRLDAIHLYRMADSLIGLSEIDEALKYYDRLSPATDSRERHRILKSLVVRNLELPQMNYDQTFAQLSKMLNEPDLQAMDRVWAIARIAEMRLEQGFIDEAINGLLLAIPRLQADGINDYPELFVLLGRGYYELGDFAQAEGHLQYAQKQLPAAAEIRGDAIALLGRIAQERGEWEEAWDLFNELVSDFPGTRPYLPGLLGRAEIDGELGRFPQALETYAQLVGDLVDAVAPGRDDYRYLPRDVVTDSLSVWHDQLVDQDQSRQALRFAQLAERLYGRGTEMPDDLLIRLAETHQTLGWRFLIEAWEVAGAKVIPQTGRPSDIADYSRLDPAARATAQSHFLSAGKYYTRRAAKLQIDEPDETAQMLRLAAIAFDQGGDYQSAIGSWSEFIRLSAGHPRQMEGIFQMGRCYQAIGEYDGAIRRFRDLIEQYPKTLEAHRSYVPLAQCYLLHPTKSDAVQAERLLLFVVDRGAPLGDGAEPTLSPQSQDYREALIQLATLYSRADALILPNPKSTYYLAAIERFDELLKRYPDDSRTPQWAYRLGGAYRLSASALAGELKIDRPQSEQRKLEAVRKEHLTRAVEFYDRAITGYQDIPAHKQTTADRQALRFAYFWRADSVFDLGDHDSAIKQYSDIADRYGDDASALVALVQIANAYAAKGEVRNARIARKRAFKRLAEIGDGVSDDELTPMGRKVWEKIVNWDRELRLTSVNEPR